MHDLRRSVDLYTHVVGLALALEVPERAAAFLWLGGRGKSVLGLWEIGSSPLSLGLHLAFSVDLAHVLAAPERLRAQGITPLSFGEVQTTEPSVLAWMPAAAVYFRDPDGHLLEYLAMLDRPPRPELGIVSWSDLPA